MIAVLIAMVGEFRKSLTAEKQFLAAINSLTFHHVTATLPTRFKVSAILRRIIFSTGTVLDSVDL